MSRYTKSLDPTNLGISLGRGFLPERDPLITLPDNWEFLDQFGKELPSLIKNGKIQEAARSLPIRDSDAMENLSESQRNRAMMIYGFGASAFIHSSKPSQTMLCRQLAIPLCRLSKQFGKPPILSYCSYALNNWTRIDPFKDIAVDNLVLLQNFVELPDEDWFILIHIDIEAKAAQAITRLLGSVLAAETGDSVAAYFHLEHAYKALDKMIETLKRMPERCSMDVYFQTVRPWIMFFENVIYEGVEDLDGQPQNFRGETGAQSSILPLLDGALGIHHADSPLTKHLAEMRLYMPHNHRALLSEVENRSKIRGLVMRGPGHLKEVYNHCLERIYEFRDIHIGYANNYIHKKVADPRGTGGTIFMPWLMQTRDETRAALLK
ncbi:MAG: hypothetical protein A2831_01405 [Candidatus Yanofskybacteria bacterium RIFCSPHIGHO2_01_FULL_44_17]|uniref:Indoleamine 2,3-dioxygenase n=1 Tax=Candidatus Yanofskybacteria bacterium RIFCSPHIGHO2_01_FULL_44_17 TaxID=1802668 RepID=A0A1F8EWY6_9BACT|nr:MAG: hypothetical protein A2831_01405 [Candidatus Yanofskybacteria bacterium RIFCSPHIGHO2_01_FULL_44_17]